eukprot:gb/GFBE01048744.1/.p1 GENE.gb/GFBE01048744.1/~~gb/GFBE01048744.1/.p1  ORF type:complete len:368 (+),score=84.73 gb/GFBE01048744.1/:1-1104(+)
MKAGKGGTYYPPFPVLGLASDGQQIFLSAGGGGATAFKEVPNVVQAHRFDEATGSMSTIASLDTHKSVVVGLTFAEAKNLWLASVGGSCRVLELSVEENTLTEVCQWQSEFEGKSPCQNLARCSPKGSIVATGGSDGIVRIYEAGKLRAEPVLKHTCDKNQEVMDLDFTKDEKFVVSCDRTGSCRIFDTATGKQTQCIDYKHAGAPLAIRGVRCLPLQPNGTQLFVAAMAAPRGPACLAIYATDGKLVREAKIHAKPLTCLGIDASGQHACVNLVTGGKRVYSLPGLSCVKKAEDVHELPAPCAAFLGEATALSGSGDRSINLLSFKKGSLCSAAVVYLLLMMVAMLIAALLVLRIGVKGAALQGEL